MCILHIFFYIVRFKRLFTHEVLVKDRLERIFFRFVKFKVAAPQIVVKLFVHWFAVFSRSEVAELFGVQLAVF